MLVLFNFIIHLFLQYQISVSLSQQQTSSMTEKLSNLFYGCKKFQNHHYQQYITTKAISDDEVRTIFSPYAEELSKIESEDSSHCLLSLFTEFIRANLKKFKHFGFQKLSTWIQISAHVFEHSFKAHLSKKQSFQYFTDVTVRHSLFRPPHSVCIFEYEQLKQITRYWMDTFHRFYEQYSECFMTEENEMLIGSAGGFSPFEKQLKKGKEVDREEVSKLVEFVNIKQVENKNEES